MEISVSRPTLWWRTTAERARLWVPVDPDLADGRQRYADRSQQRWDRIAAVVANVGDALAARAWAADPADPTVGLVKTKAAHLTDTEHEIATSWFHSSELVQVDPWFKPIQGGRHRLWSTFPHFRGRLVPMHASSMAWPDLTTFKPEIFRANVDELDSLAWFDVQDPLNARFRESLVLAAAGVHPPPV